MANLPDVYRWSTGLSNIVNIAAQPRFLIKNILLNLRCGVSRKEHIFVLGPPRSGTTLLMSIVSAHSSVSGHPEESYLFLKKNFLNIKTNIISKEKINSIVLSSSSRVDLFDRVLSIYQSGNDTIAEKTPEHALVLDKMMSAYPNSRFIGIVRDPRDGYASARRNPELDSWTLENYAEVWRKCAMGIRKKSNLKNISWIRYEDLCTNPQKEISKVNKHLRLKTEKSQLHPEGYSDRTILKGRKGHERLESSISSKTVGKWRKQIEDKQAKYIYKICKSEMNFFGY